MGYRSYMSGEISVFPAFTVKEMEDSPFLMFDPDMKSYYSAKPPYNKAIAFAHESSIEPAYGPDMGIKYLNLHADMQELLDCFPTHSFNGMITVRGESLDDIWMVYIDILHRKAVKVDGVVTWSDGVERSFR